LFAHSDSWWWLGKLRARQSLVTGRNLSLPEIDSSVLLPDPGAAIHGAPANCDDIFKDLHAGQFDLLGLTGLSFGAAIDWHLDPVSAKRSPLIGWKRLDNLDPTQTGDRKIVWELNRHQHLLQLAQCFRSTRDPKYALLVREHIRSWIAANPVDTGINWASSLELAFRSISWVWALALTREWAGWTEPDLKSLVRSIHDQASHIERHLSYYSSPNTHLTGEALGLYYVGTCLPALRRAARWRALGRRILLDELDRHVRPDGVYFEQSSWYHRYTADFYTHFVLLAQRSGDKLPPVVLDRLQALMEHLMWITRPDGTSPYVGDDDGGKLVKLEARPPDDWRAVLSNGAVLFKRPDFKHVAGRFADETLWLFGEDARVQFDALPAAPPAALSRAFPDGGYFVMRDGWQRDSRYLLVDCGPHGFSNGGHAHADALSIELSALGQNFLTDPGTFVYTADLAQRNLFRSTAMHNTLTLESQGSSEPAGPFQWRSQARSSLACWHDHPGFTYLRGSHDGYRRLPSPATHERSIFFVNRDYWVMLDRVLGEGRWAVELNFHAAPGVKAELIDAGRALRLRGAGASLLMHSSLAAGSWSLQEGWVSRCYGARDTAPWAKFEFPATSNEAVLTVLRPFGDSAPAPAIQSVAVDSGCAMTIESPGQHDMLAWSVARSSDLGLVDNDFEWVAMRRSAASGALQQLILLHGAQIRTPEFEVDFGRMVKYAVFHFDGSQMRISVDSPVTPVRMTAPAGLQPVLTVADQTPDDCCAHVRR
jgi:hypothetical protein